MGDWIASHIETIIQWSLGVIGFVYLAAKKESALVEKNNAQDKVQRSTNQIAVLNQQHLKSIEAIVSNNEKRISLIENSYPRQEEALEKIQEAFQKMTETMVEMKTDLKNVFHRLDRENNTHR